MGKQGVMTRSMLLMPTLLLTFLATAGLASRAEASTSEQLSAMAVTEPFDGSSASLERFASKWSVLGWATGASPKGEDTSTGWKPLDSLKEKVDGASYNPIVTDGGSGIATITTMAGGTFSAGRYLSIWLDMKSPASTRAGYELRFAYTNVQPGSQSGPYTVTLSKWLAGSKTTLATQKEYSFSPGNSFALIDAGGTVSAWTNTGAGFNKLLSASDASFSNGNAGVEGINGKLTNFKVGTLSPPAAPTLSWTAPASPAVSNSPKIAGSAESGSTVKLYSNATCTGTPVAEGTSAAFAAPGLAVSVSDNTTTTYHATATDGAGNVSSCSASSIKYVENSKDILFEGSRISEFALLQQCVPGRITEVPDPLGSGRTVLDFTAKDTDVVENSECSPGSAPTNNPRATALSPSFIEPGDEFWLRCRFLIPQGFPPVPGWMTLISVYGSPATSTSPWRVEVKNNEFTYQRNETYNWDIPWSAPLITGQWVEVLTHERFGYDGWLEVWLNGTKLHFFEPESSWNPGNYLPTEKLEMETMDSTNNEEPNSVRIGQYREHHMIEAAASVYYEFLKVGATRESIGG